MVGAADAVTLDDPAARYVSRSALKLVAALAPGAVSAEGQGCLGVGSSTGGFTQRLLERGADKVFAVDVGHGQLHEKLHGDGRVVSLESTNARELARETIPDVIDLLVSDVSFVSVTKVLEAPLALCAEKADAVILFK